MGCSIPLECIPYDRSEVGEVQDMRIKGRATESKELSWQNKGVVAIALADLRE